MQNCNLIIFDADTENFYWQHRQLGNTHDSERNGNYFKDRKLLLPVRKAAKFIVQMKL